jgi:hypothetical protein
MEYAFLLQMKREAFSDYGTETPERVVLGPMQLIERRGSIISQNFYDILTINTDPSIHGFDPVPLFNRTETPNIIL